MNRTSVNFMGYAITQREDKNKKNEGQLQIDLTFTSKDLLLGKYADFIDGFNQFLRVYNEQKKAVATTTTYETIEEDLGNGRMKIYKQEISEESASMTTTSGEPVDQMVFLMGYGIEQNADKGHLRLDLTFISKDLLMEKYGAFIKDFNQFLLDRNKKLVKP